MTHLRLLLFHLLFLPPPSSIVAAPMHRDCTRDQNACIRTPRKRSSPNFLARNRATTTTNTNEIQPFVHYIRYSPFVLPSHDLSLTPSYSVSFQIIPSAIKIYIYIFDFSMIKLNVIPRKIQDFILTNILDFAPNFGIIANQG